MEKQLQEKYELLIKIIKNAKSLIIAFSGGVDSTFLLYAASQALEKDKILGITACSPTYPKSELEETIEFTKIHNIPHKIIETDEVETINAQGNSPERCYFCKHELFSCLMKIAKEEGYQQIAEGSNTDDDNDYRPGRKAIKELGILSPLKQANLSKNEIRILSKKFKLPTWDKPAYACLTSRFPYYVDISQSALSRIEKAEEYLKNRGFKQCRVRHYGEKARIEVEKAKVPLALEIADEIITTLKKLGYSQVEIDPEGYKTGSMNVF